MKAIVWMIGLLAAVGCTVPEATDRQAAIAAKVDSLIALMTVEEKVGQMYQCLGRGHAIVGDGKKAADLLKRVAAGEVGSILVPGDVDDVREMQQIAVEQSRLGIPLFFNYDVIHGFRTIFPVPLAMSCSWDTAWVARAHRIAAIEAAAAGISYNHGPMADISRDPRWGRVMEGNGEDPYLGSLFTAAAVRGFQGPGIDHPLTIMACAKHFIGYGAVEGGKDYNTVDIGEETLRNIHLPPFRAALGAGAGSVMTSFNVVGSIPAVAHRDLLQGVLRNELGFDGIVISDFGSIAELIPHGYVARLDQAAEQALRASVDIEMQSGTYHRYIGRLIDEGRIGEELLDDAVRRILTKKFEAGLFENPYRFRSKAFIDSVTLSDAHRAIAREVAKRSVVLLKNGTADHKKVLPFAPEIRKIAVIGPFADTKNILGRWSAKGDTAEAVSLAEGLRNVLGAGCGVVTLSVGDFWENSLLDESRIVKTAREADIVVLALGEPIEMSGEGASRAILDIPGNQKRIAELALKGGKPVVLVLFSGRPLVLPWYEENMHAILAVWYPGTEGGNAIAEILSGQYNPSGRLTMTFPRHEGQIPVYYNHYNTGRPAGDSRYSSKYMDIENTPLYPFGYGLSYSEFTYGELQLDKDTMRGPQDSIRVSVQVTNSGSLPGEEVVQLYIRDHAGSIVRPVKELKGFRKITLAPRQSRTVTFQIYEAHLKYWSPVVQGYTLEPGAFSVMAGPNSADVKTKKFTLTDKEL